MNSRHILPILLFPLLTGCDMLYDLLEIPNPSKEAEVAESEGKAVGSACRHAGRSLEDCYILNPTAQKAAVFRGWKEMNDYMIQNNMQVVPSQFTPTTPPPPPATEERKPDETAKAEPAPH